MTTHFHPARIALVLLPAAACLLLVASTPPVAQSLAYHEFADGRTLFGVANFMDVASNLPFLAVGGLGLAFLLDARRSRGAFDDPRERWAYLLFFAGVAFTSAGSAFYHLAPDNARLTWDRLPMTVGFMPLLAATVAERVSLRAGLRLLAPLLLLGVGSVVWWRFSAWLGVEDLRPYLAVQFGSIFTIALMALLLPSRYRRGNDIGLVFAFYALAKVAELADGWLFEHTGWISGHSAKHLLAAAAVGFVLRMLVLRGRQRGAAAGCRS